MRVITVVKWSRDPVDARVGQDGTVDWRGVKMSSNDDDPAVMEVARACGDDIVAVTIGDGDVAWAAARGAGRTIVIEDAATEVNSAATGAALVAAIRRCGEVDAVIISDSAWDYGVVAALTGQLGWTAVAGVLAAEPDQAGLRVTRRAGSQSEVVQVPTPVVLAATATRAEPNPPGMKEVLAARKKPVERLTLAELGLPPTDVVESRGTRLPEASKARLIDGADPDAASAELIAALRADGVV